MIKYPNRSNDVMPIEPVDLPVHQADQQLTVEIGGKSIAGKNPVNEDAFAARNPNPREVTHKGIVACIADGASCGDSAQIASQTSVTNFIEDYYSTPDSWSVNESAACVLSSLNSWLFNNGRQGSQQDSLVTTFSAVILKSATLHTLHVGDSRIYRLRDQHLRQITGDHTHKQMGGQLLLTRGLGMDSHLQVDYSKHELKTGDLLVLTSDGVHQSLTDFEITNVLLKSGNSLETTAQQLIDRALERGSEDNLSCLLVRVSSIPSYKLDEVHRQLTERKIPPVLEPGMTLDGYEILSVLHSGPRSHVYAVRDSQTRKQYALKAPSINFEDDPVYLDFFVREQWVGRRLNHPNIMKIYAGSGSSRFLYHLCEYINGQTLRQWMFDNPKPPIEKVRTILKTLVLAMRAFQRMSMVHRDLKPENILVDANGTIKVIDFGAVQISGLAEMSRLIRESVPQGAIDYTSPEYIQYGSALRISDLYSMGAIAYEMLCGGLPYKERRVGDKHYTWVYRSIRIRRPDIPLWVDLALEKSVEPNPAKRQQALSEFLHDMCSPNKSLIRQHESLPLLERNPVLVWQSISAVLLLALILTYLF